jgi:dGTPase
MSPHVKHAVITLREFMFEKVYVPEDRGKEGDAARRMVRLLYCHFSENKSQIPAEYGARSKSEERAVVDYVSGMTDRYAIRMAESIQPGIGRIFHERLV